MFYRQTARAFQGWCEMVLIKREAMETCTQVRVCVCAFVCDSDLSRIHSQLHTCLFYGWCEVVCSSKAKTSFAIAFCQQ